MEQAVEIWKDIIGLEGMYQISSAGRVRSLDRITRCGGNGGHSLQKGKMRKIHIGTTGYYFVSLCNRSKTIPYKIHRLLAIHFIPNPENKRCVNHKDGNKLNNSLDNLEWCTSSENNLHAFRTGLKKSTRKLNCVRVRPVIQTPLNGESAPILWPSIMETTRNGYDKGEVIKACKGRIKTYRNCIWQYAA